MRLRMLSVWVGRSGWLGCTDVRRVLAEMDDVVLRAAAVTRSTCAGREDHLSTTSSLPEPWEPGGAVLRSWVASPLLVVALAVPIAALGR